jgi:hypothetical protein
MAACPAHEDRTPSLSIRELPDGRVLIHCHAGCGAADVLTAVGLAFSDLYPPSMVDDGRPVPRHARGISTKAARDWIEDASHAAAVLAVILTDLDAGLPLTDKLADRFAEAAGIILGLAKQRKAA